MTEAEFINTLLNTLPNLGIGIIFLYLYLAERKRSASMTERIIELHKESVVASKDMKFALENNTKAIETLVGRVDKLGA